MALRIGDEGGRERYFLLLNIMHFWSITSINCLYPMVKIESMRVVVRAIVDVPIVVTFNQRHDRLLFGEKKNESSHAGDV